jgi:hypothetical protein
MEGAAELVIGHRIRVDTRRVGPGERLLDPEDDAEAVAKHGQVMRWLREATTGVSDRAAE